MANVHNVGTLGSCVRFMVAARGGVQFAAPPDARAVRPYIRAACVRWGGKCVAAMKAQLFPPFEK